MLAELARVRPLRHPRPPRPGQGLGRARPRPTATRASTTSPAVEAIAETGIAVEVSTAGLRKPVGELYPAPAFAEMCVEAGAAFASPPTPTRPSRSASTTSGRSRRSATWGVAEICVFERRERRLEPLGVGEWVGIGYDSHRFAAGRRLVLGGVEIEHEPGLEGHSDADVLTHAVIDALLGAAGLGDLGTHFPPEEERWRDADSLDLLRTVPSASSAARDQRRRDRDLRGAAARAAPAGDGAQPRRGDLGAPVSVKATTNEGMGWIGRGEGIACIAVALGSTPEPDRRRGRLREMAMDSARLASGIAGKREVKSGRSAWLADVPFNSSTLAEAG